MPAECELREDGCEHEPFALCGNCQRAVCAACCTNSGKGLMCWACWDALIERCNQFVRTNRTPPSVGKVEL